MFYLLIYFYFIYNNNYLNKRNHGDNQIVQMAKSKAKEIL